MTNSGFELLHDEKKAVVFIEINTDELNYRWSYQIPYHNRSAAREAEVAKVEIELWASLVRRLVRMSKLEKEAV